MTESSCFDHVFINMFIIIRFNIKTPTTIGIFYRPPNQANFMELIVKSFYLLNLKDNEIYLLGDFNINLLQNGNYILNRKGMAVCQGAVHTLINKYQEFCQIFSLKQLITM